ncbi:MAG: hypothetical protein ACI94Y_003082 [Maribacter sp.]
MILLANLSSFTQQKDKAIPISMGLYGAYVIQPGIKIGTAFNLKNWAIEKDDKTKSRSLFISPQIGIFIRPKNNTSFVLNVDIAYKALSTADKNDLKFEVLSDVGNTIAKEYGIVFQLTDEVAKNYNKSFDLNGYNGDESNELPLAAT